MPRMDPKERAELERKLREDDETPDEPDFEVEWWEETADGSRRGGKLPWAKAKSIYGKWAPDLFADKPPETDDDAQPGQEEGKSGTVRFGRRVS